MSPIHTSRPRFRGGEPARLAPPPSEACGVSVPRADAMHRYGLYYRPAESSVQGSHAHKETV